jgi:hypothetical protein
VQAGEGRVDGRVVALQEALALPAVGLLHRGLDLGDGLVRGRMPEMAKKQVCMMVLMRRPMPVSPAIL